MLATTTTKAHNFDAHHVVCRTWARCSAAGGIAGLERSGDPEFCRRQSRVILLLSASRSGASWLTELCAGSASLCSLPGEIDPFLILGLGPPDVSRGESDLLGAQNATPELCRVLSTYLHHFVGNQSRSGRSWMTPQRRFQVAMRTLLQWPELHERLDEVFDAIGEAFVPTHAPSHEPQMIAYLGRLKELLPSLNPYFYDVDPVLIRNRFPDERVPAGPPHDAGVIEEPPFVCEMPWDCALDAGAAERPLLLKSPSNAYRLDFLRTLFPNAEIAVIHLIRDPVASITGLMSGWLHHGFFKHRMPDGALNIDRYTRPDTPWTSAWWKFDLPPDWQRYAHRPLEEVCGFQWTSANEHIARWVERQRSDIHYVQTSPHRLTIDLKGEMARLFAELGLRPDAGLLAALALNRRTMVSYGVGDETRAKLRHLAAEVADSARIRDLLRRLTDVGAGLALDILPS